MKEEDIRPQEMFNRYLGVVREDISQFFSDKRDFVEVACPGCDSEDAAFAFEKLSFLYRTCRNCGSLYVSPRPSEAALNEYYRRGKAVEFWSTDFYRQTQEARREKLFAPRAQIVAELAKRRNAAGRETFVDVGAGYGIFLEEVARLGLFEKVEGIEPAPAMAEVCRGKGFDIVEKPVEALSRAEVQADVATTFEVLEHVFSPADFLKAIRRVLKPDGVLLYTTLTISGFDLQVLWDRSKTIYPPHHINFISVDGMRRLLGRCGFEVIEISTPGKLDLDIVANARKEDPNLDLPRFVERLLSSGDETHREFQSFLQRNHLSSHIRCVARNRIA